MFCVKHILYQSLLTTNGASKIYRPISKQIENFHIFSVSFLKTDTCITDDTAKKMTLAAAPAAYIFKFNPFLYNVFFIINRDRL